MRAHSPTRSATATSSSSSSTAATTALNTVVPVDNGGGSLPRRLRRTRARLTSRRATSPTPLIGTDPNTGAQLGAPSRLPRLRRKRLGGFKALWDAGHVAVVQGCGYPELQPVARGRAASWQTGEPLGTLGGSGWVGRYLADPASYAADRHPGRQHRDRIVAEFRQTTTSVLAVNASSAFGFPYDHGYDDSTTTARQTRRLRRPARRRGRLERSRRCSTSATSGDATLSAARAFRSSAPLRRRPRRKIFADVRRRPRRRDPQGLARDLREVAKIIYGVEQRHLPGVNARFFQVSNGGYDTHSGPGGGRDRRAALHAARGASAPR